LGQQQIMPPSRSQITESARKAAEQAKEHRRAAAAAAAGTVAAAARIGIRRYRQDGALFDSDAFRLLPGETVSAGLKRVIRAQVDDAIAQLRGEAGTGEAVHEARKDLKKTRSALRLVRKPLGDAYQRENEHYREVGRALSSFRDAEVLIEALDELIERFGDAAGEHFVPLRDELGAQARAASDDGSLERAMAHAAAALDAGRPRIEELPLSGDGWRLIGPGLQRSYRRGRKRLAAVEDDATVTNLHEWRKRVKDLWYQLRLIREADRELIGSLADHAHGLSDHLGDDHDLALLREEGMRRSDVFGEAGDQRLLFELIDQRRGELQFAALSLGRRIYEEKPKKFTKRLESRWRSR
jgi:CHAD domain-containing protein